MFNEKQSTSERCFRPKSENSSSSKFKSSRMIILYHRYHCSCIIHKNLFLLFLMCCLIGHLVAISGTTTVTAISTFPGSSWWVLLPGVTILHVIKMNCYHCPGLIIFARGIDVCCIFNVTSTVELVRQRISCWSYSKTVE